MVEAYQQTVFAVRPHLDALDWVLRKAVGSGPWNDFGGGQLGAVWKYTAYTAGPRALEVVMAVTTDQPLPGWARSSCRDDLGYGERRLRLLGQLTLAALSARSDGEFQSLGDARDRLRRLDRQATGTRQGRTGLLPAMEDFLGSIGSRGKSARKAAAERPKPGGRTSGIRGAVKARKREPVTSLLAAMR